MEPALLIPCGDVDWQAAQEVVKLEFTRDLSSRREMDETDLGNAVLRQTLEILDLGLDRVGRNCCRNDLGAEWDFS